MLLATTRRPVLPLEVTQRSDERSTGKKDMIIRPSFHVCRPRELVQQTAQAGARP
jgi:hypothetical protein